MFHSASSETVASGEPLTAVSSESIAGGTVPALNGITTHKYPDGGRFFVSVAAVAPRPFRFGTVTTSGTDFSRRHWTEHVRRVEGLGFSTVVVADHFGNTTVCTPRLAAAASVTTTLRLGSYVYDNDFRHPVLLAREAAEIDVLSDGRMELGIGAGWANTEYEMVGIPFDPGPTRATRFEEAVAIIGRLHSGETVTQHGEFYQLEDCGLSVEPVQQPIPLLLGGGGPRMTRFAANHADIVGYVPKSLPGGGLDPVEFSVDAFDAKVALLERAIADAASSAGPERGVLLFYAGRTADGMPKDGEGWTSPAILVDSPYALVGDTEQMVETLLERRERWGLTYFTCWEEDVDVLAPVVDRLAGT
jgi:probable F420-dependent oxidoreductase